MTLHHVAHLSVSASYLMANMHSFGHEIGFFHDASDILIQLSKGLHLAGYSMPWSLIAFLCAQVVWVCMRLMGFPALLYNVV